MTSEDLFTYLSENAAAMKVGGGMKAMVLFDLTGPDGAQWLARLENGAAVLEKGGPGEAAADVTVTASMATALGIAQKTVNPMMAFLTGKIKASGDPKILGEVKKMLKF